MAPPSRANAAVHVGREHLPGQHRLPVYPTTLLRRYIATLRHCTTARLDLNRQASRGCSRGHTARPVVIAGEHRLPVAAREHRVVPATRETGAGNPHVRHETVVGGEV